MIPIYAHKDGVYISTFIAYTQPLDRANGNTLWMDDYDQNMKNNAIGFKVLQPGEREPRGYNNISIHLIWDVNIDFTGKYLLVSNGNLIHVPP